MPRLVCAENNERGPGAPEEPVHHRGGEHGPAVQCRREEETNAQGEGVTASACFVCINAPACRLSSCVSIRTLRALTRVCMDDWACDAAGEGGGCITLPVVAGSLPEVSGMALTEWKKAARVTYVSPVHHLLPLMPVCLDDPFQADRLLQYMRRPSAVDSV